ncbi:MAG TPA: VCBS repeat-containing protein, partial [Chthonomonadales bacterium]|nr:VCBS repeat-containing protein [Chthonomonadales bacterium]
MRNGTRFHWNHVWVVAVFAAAFSEYRPTICLTQVAFAPPVTYQLDTQSDDLLAVDLDGDGKLDLVSANGNNIAVLYGNGDGTFGAPVNYYVGGSLEEIIATDVNRDGKL